MSKKLEYCKRHLDIKKQWTTNPIIKMDDLLTFESPDGEGQTIIELTENIEKCDRCVELAFLEVYSPKEYKKIPKELL